MKSAIMQPYLFPYLGYYQLVYVSDVFVFYDDVTYIKGGYINRNYILSQGDKQRFTMPLNGASSNVLIKDIECQVNMRKLITLIEQSYSKAPYFEQIMPIINRVILSNERSLSVIASKSITEVFKYLGINKIFKFSSDIEYDQTENPSDKVISICFKNHCDEYINSIGGSKLYNKDEFENKGLSLSFIEKKTVTYTHKAAGKVFIDNLSMIDVLMWNSKEDVIKLLNDYELL